MCSQPDPAAYDNALLVPSLPNIRLKLLLPSPLVSFPPPLCSKPSDIISLHVFFPHFFFLPFLFCSKVYSTSFPSHFQTLCPQTLPSIHTSPPTSPLVCVGLTSDGQGESEVLDWLEEVEEGGSDWLNSFFTFLYGLINPLEHLEEEEQEEHRASGGLYEAHEEDEEDEDDRGVRKREAHDNGYQGQKIVIVGLHNQ